LKEGLITTDKEYEKKLEELVEVNLPLERGKKRKEITMPRPMTRNNVSPPLSLRSHERTAPFPLLSFSSPSQHFSSLIFVAYVVNHWQEGGLEGGI